MSDTVKYKNLTELAKAFEDGELSRDEWAVWLDNDCSGLTWIGPTPTGDDEYAFVDRKREEGRTLYRGNGYHDLGDALDALNIPWQDV